MQSSVLSYEKICPEDVVKERIVVQFSNSNSKIFVNEAYCVNPACSCSEITLTFIELADDDHLMNNLFTMKLDMVSWKVTDKKVNGKKSISDKMMKEFLDHMEELKSRLIAHAMQAKDFGRKHYLDYLPEHVVTMLFDGVVVAYSEVFGSVDADVFSFERIEGERWFIEDQYCSNPKCQCDDVVLSFYKHDSSVKVQEVVFTVRMKLKSFKYDIESSFCEKELMTDIMKFLHSNKPQLFAAVQRRYRDIKEAGKETVKKFKSENKQEIQKILEATNMPGVQYTQEIQKTVKISRNDPCHCGSGMKYKKCCGR